MQMTTPKVGAGRTAGTPDTAPGPYYVSAIDEAGNTHLMAGPYELHGAALADVKRVLDIAYEHDGRSWFMAWGTVRVEGCERRGRLNELGLI